jgi:hypothetical protein
MLVGSSLGKYYQTIKSSSRKLGCEASTVVGRVEMKFEERGGIMERHVGA